MKQLAALRSSPQLRAMQRLRTQLAMVFQHFNLWSHMTVLENITLAPRRVLGISKKEAEERARRYLEIGRASCRERV